MNWKGITFSIALVIGALACLFFAAGGVLPLSAGPVSFDDSTARWIMGGTAALLLVIAVVVEVTSRQKRVAISQPRDESATATHWLYSMDTYEGALFPELTERAHRVSILSRTAVNVLNQYRHEIERMCVDGCQFRILMPDPSAEAVFHSYGETYSNNAATALSYLEVLEREYPGIEHRFMDKPLTMSIVWVERAPKSGSIVQVLLYFWYKAKGRHRPMFRVAAGERWYDEFTSEFEALWHEAGKSNNGIERTASALD